MKKLTTNIDDTTAETITKMLEARNWGIRKTGRLIDEAVQKLSAWEESEMKTVTITNRSKLGWGWTTWTPERPEPPSKPEWVGTHRQVCEAIQSDRTYQSCVSGGTYLATAWFVKTPAGWKRIVDNHWDLEYGPCKVELE
jgi:hypothetical protein